MFTLYEGGSYTLKATVTNTSTKGGQPMAAILELQLRSQIMSGPRAGQNLFDTKVASQLFAAGQSIAFSYPFTIPTGTGAAQARVTAQIFDPSERSIAIVTEDIFIPAPEVFPATHFSCVITLKNIPAWCNPLDWGLIFASYNPNIADSEYYRVNSNFQPITSLTLTGRIYAGHEQKTALYLSIGNGVAYAMSTWLPFIPVSGATYILDVTAGTINGQMKVA